MSTAAHIIREWRQNPIKFAWDNFQFEPDVWQREALDAFASEDLDKRRIALRACVGPGKSAILAICAWNFLLCYGDKGNHPKGAAVSITADNLKDNLWSELSKWQSRSQLLLNTFTWTKERVFANDHPATWFLSARSFSKTANSEEQGRTLSGLHSDFVLVLIDESGDIPVQVAKAGEQALSSAKWCKILQAGNPTSHEGILYAAATSLADLWFNIVITSDPDDPRRSKRVDADWAREQIKAFGRDNPWIMSSILGQFPPSSINTLLGVDEVEAATKRGVSDYDVSISQKRLGVDCARFGDDRTVIFPRQGLLAYKPVEMRGARSNDIAARVAQAKNKWKSELEFVDGTGGFGSGVIDSLLQTGFSPLEIHFSGKAIDSRYYNKRAEMWFQMAEWIRRGGCIPKDSELVKELTAPTYTFQNGKFLLEPKEKIKERLGFSPDKADALALTFALPDMPGRDNPELILNQNKMVVEFDPFRSEDDYATKR